MGLKISLAWDKPILEKPITTYFLTTPIRMCTKSQDLEVALQSGPQLVVSYNLVVSCHIEISPSNK